MDADETAIDVFTTRVRQMILQYKELKLQNAQLCSAIDALKADVSSLEEQLRKQREEYTNLKLARMVAITDGDMRRRRSESLNSYATSTSALRLSARSTTNK